jgi:TonB family protein
VRVLTLLLALFLPAILPAQSTESDLKARLVNKPLYLRGLWSEDRLDFDEIGKPFDTYDPTSITLAGINIKSVKLTPKALILEGTRAGLTFQKDTPKRINIRLSESPGFGAMFRSHDRKMHVEIKPPANGDFTHALNVIFTDNIADLVPALPDYWHGFFDRHLADIQAMRPLNYTAEKFTPIPGLNKVGGAVTPPRVLHQPEPEFDDEARGSRLSGRVLVYLQIDATGTPTHVRILRPVGLGLDERAVAAVQQYSFNPAMRNGTPVTVEMNVEVNFQIY